MLFFTHVEKAAGMSVHNFLSSFMPSYYRAAPYKINPKEWSADPHMSARSIELLACFSPWLKVMGGHPFQVREINKSKLKEIHHLIFFRDPVERYTSHYNYQREVMGVSWSDEEFLSQEGYKNFACKKICGVGSFVQAKDVLEKSFIFYGLVEEMERSLELLKVALLDWGYISKKTYENVSVVPPKVNSRSSRKGDGFVALDEGRVVENNSEDILLYRYIVDEVWAAQERKLDLISGEGGAFDMGATGNVGTGRSHLLFTAYYRMIESFLRKNDGYSLSKSIMHYHKLK